MLWNDPTATTMEKTLGSFALAVAVIGGVLGLLVLLATGMSNVAASARSQLLFAFPLPAVGAGLSSAALIVSYRRGKVRSCLPTALSALIISVGMILLVVAALKSYSR